MRSADIAESLTAAVHVITVVHSSVSAEATAEIEVAAQKETEKMKLEAQAERDSLS